jgi:uncharacterized protein YndB with AHSA1/START domain
MILEASTHVDRPPEAVFRFFEEVDRHYEAWHPDHVTFRWVKGRGPEAGNEAYFEERVGGQLKKQRVRYTAVEKDRYIELAPTSLWVRLILPQISFRIEPEDAGCRLTQRIRIRVGPIGARLNRRELDAVRAHMEEEGAQLKRIVENGG